MWALPDCRSNLRNARANMSKSEPIPGFDTACFSGKDVIFSQIDPSDQTRARKLGHRKRPVVNVLQSWGLGCCYNTALQRNVHRKLTHATGMGFKQGPHLKGSKDQRNKLGTRGHAKAGCTVPCSKGPKKKGKGNRVNRPHRNRGGKARSSTWRVGPASLDGVEAARQMEEKPKENIPQKRQGKIDAKAPVSLQSGSGKPNRKQKRPPRRHQGKVALHLRSSLLSPAQRSGEGPHGHDAPDENAGLLEQVGLSKAHIIARAQSSCARHLPQHPGSLRAPSASGLGDQGLEPHILGCAELGGVEVLPLDLRVGRGSSSRNMSRFRQGVQPLGGRNGYVKCSWGTIENRNENVRWPPLATPMVIWVLREQQPWLLLLRAQADPLGPRRNEVTHSVATLGPLTSCETDCCVMRVRVQHCIAFRTPGVLSSVRHLQAQTELRHEQRRLHLPGPMRDGCQESPPAQFSFRNQAGPFHRRSGGHLGIPARLVQQSAEVLLLPGQSSCC